MWKFCEDGQIPQSFGCFARNSEEILCFHKNFHTRKLGETVVFYAVWVLHNDEFQLKNLSLGHLYSVSYYQKTLEKKGFPKKLIANSLQLLMVSYRVLFRFWFLINRNLHDRGNIYFPEKRHTQICKKHR